MSTANVSKVKESVLANLIFNLKVFSKKGLFLSKSAYFLKSKNNVIFSKMRFLNEAAYACVNMCKYITWQLLVTCYNTFIQL